MKSNFLWPIIVALTGFFVEQFSTAMGLDFSVVFSGLQVEHYLFVAYLLILCATITWSIATWYLKSIKKKLDSYKKALEKYKNEDEEIANLRAIVNHQNETSSVIS